MMKALVALVAASIAAPAPNVTPRLEISQTVTEKPMPAGLKPDIVARAKFLKVNAGVIDRISYVNHYVNSNMRGVTDLEQYGEEELWVMAPASGAGDCEDYSLTKLYLLVKLGYPELAMRIVGLVVTEDGQRYAHAVLELILPDGSHAFLDNLHADLMTRPELEADGYQFVPWGE